MKKIRITNDSGIGHKTEIIDAETGEPIQNIRKIGIHIEVGYITTAEIEFILPEVDIIANTEEKDDKIDVYKEYISIKEYYMRHNRCPKCGQDKFVLSEVERTTGPIFESKSNPYRIRKDQNKANCVCGWAGIVHDLIDEKEYIKR